MLYLGKMNLLQTIKNSIYSPEFYKTVPQKSLKSVFGYFFLIVLITTIIAIIQGIIWITPDFLLDSEMQTKDFAQQVVNHYPQELEVKIDQGQVTTNVAEPYFITLPMEGFQTDGHNIRNLLVIDTKTSYSSFQMEQYQTIGWLTRDTLFLKSDQETDAIDVSEFDNVTINRDFVQKLETQISPLYKYVGPAILATLVFGSLLINLFRIFAILFMTLLVLLLLKVMRKDINFSKAFKITTFAITLAVIIETVQGFILFPGIPFMGTVVTLLVVYFNFRSQK